MGERTQPGIQLLALVLGVIACSGIPLQGARAQPVDPPEFLEEIRLTARLHVGIDQIRHRMRPIGQANLRFLDQPVDPVVRSVSPTYGLSAGLRFRDTELFGSLRTNGGFYPEMEYTSRSGEPLFYGETVSWTMSARLQHLVGGLVGAGLEVEEWDLTWHGRDPVLASGEDPGLGLLSGRFHANALLGYVPVRISLHESVQLDGKVGTSILGTAGVRYGFQFARIERSEDGGLVYNRDTSGDWRRQVPLPEASDISVQVVEAGVTYSGSGVPLRLGVRARREETVTTAIWSYGASLRAGFPF